MFVLRRAFCKQINSINKRNKKCEGLSYLRTLSTNAPDLETGILTSGVNDVEIPETTIHDLVYSNNHKYHRFIATECPITGKKLSFEQIRVKSRNLSKSLRKFFKLQKGDVVAILLPNVPEYTVAAFGTLEAGLTITSLNPIYTPDEISRQLQNSSAKAVITLTSLYPTAKTSVDLLKKQLPIVTIKFKSSDSLPQGAIDFEEMVNADVDIPEVGPISPNDIAFLPYSSGTTGLPKGVVLTHRNVVANIAQITHKKFDYMVNPTDDEQDITPAILPLFHIYGFTITMVNTLYRGCRVLTLPKFTPESYLDVLKRYPISIIYAAPPLVLFLSTFPGVKAEYFKSLRIMQSGASPLGHLDEERFIQKTGKPIQVLQGYGLTEASPVVTLRSYSEIKAVGSVGKPLPNTEVKIMGLDGTGKPLGPNQQGELLARGPQIMSKYHNNPEETNNTIVDGWLKTGDMAYYDENGFIFITDRLKELIKVKGFQVAPAELEEVIRDFPTVKDAAVIGVPHPVYGEVPRAYVVIKENEKFQVADLEQYVSEKVAPFKQLKGGVEIVESIPKNSSGKILRRELKLKFDQNPK